MKDKRGRIYLFPMPERRVKDPVSMAVLPADGAWVKHSSYYRRRMRDGDAIEGAPGKTPAAVASARKRVAAPVSAEKRPPKQASANIKASD